MRELKKWQLISLVSILVIAAIMRFGWIFYAHTVPVFDFAKYHMGAVSLAQGEGYKLYGAYTAFEPIGFAAWLAILYKIFGVNILVPQIFNVLLSLGIIFLSFLIGKKLFNTNIGLLTAFILCFSPRNIAYTSVISTEIFFTFFLCLTVYLFLTREWRGKYVVLGVLAAILAYTKPFMLLFPGAIFLMLLLTKWNELKNFKESFLSSLKKVIILTLVMLACIAPWTARNYMVFHKFMLISSNGGITLYLNNNDYAKGSWQDPFNIPGSPIVGMRDEQTGFWDEIKVDEIAGREGKEWILSHPWEFFKLGFQKMYNVYNKAWDVYYAVDFTDSGGPMVNRGWIYTLAAQGYKIFLYGMLLYIIMAIINIFTKKKQFIEQGLTLIIFLMFNAVFFIFEGQPRYLFPLIPLLSVLIAWGASFFAVFLKEGDYIKKA